MQTRGRVGAVAAVAAAALLGITGTAIAHGDSGGTADGHGTFALASFDFHVQRDDDGHVSGYFKARATEPGGAFVAPEGPVTCAVFQGNTVSFLYPLEDNTMPGFIKGTVIQITAQDNGGNGQDKIGFFGPAPAAAFHGCQPQPTPFAVTSGHTQVDSDAGDSEGSDEDSDD